MKIKLCIFFVLMNYRLSLNVVTLSPPESPSVHFPQFSPTCLDKLSWNFDFDFVFLNALHYIKKHSKIVMTGVLCIVPFAVLWYIFKLERNLSWILLPVTSQSNFVVWKWRVFSSPEPKARVSYCHSAPSVVRPSVRPSSVRPCGVNFSHFRLLLQNCLMDFDETW